MLTIQPGLYFCAAAVAAANVCGLTDEEISADIDAVIADTTWNTVRVLCQTMGHAYTAAVLRMAADVTDDVTDGCVFYATVGG